MHASLLVPVPPPGLENQSICCFHMDDHKAILWVVTHGWVTRLYVAPSDAMAWHMRMLCANHVQWPMGAPHWTESCTTRWHGGECTRHTPQIPRPCNPCDDVSPHVMRQSPRKILRLRSPSLNPLRPLQFARGRLASYRMRRPHTSPTCLAFRLHEPRHSMKHFGVNGDRYLK